jgi:Tol biopolymer transport system component
MLDRRCRRKENAVRCRGISVVIGATVLAASGLAAQAEATAPAQNGRIAFVRRALDDSTSAVYVVNPDGSGERRVTRPSAPDRDEHPDWAADGKLLLFERCTPSGSCRIYSVTPDGTGLKRRSPACPRAARGCLYRAPALSPDGRRTAFLYNAGSLASPGASALYVADAQLRHRRLVAGSRALRGSADAPAWSPDGRRLAFGVIHGTGSGETAADGRAVFVVGADGKGLRRLTPWSLRAGDRPDWSPDGRSILVRSESNRDGGFGSNLYTVHADGSSVRNVTRFSDGRRVLAGTYAPDGTAIVISASAAAGGLPNLFVLRPDGTGAKPITRSAEWDASPDWGPRR